MENLVFTQLSIAEVRQLFRLELESFFEKRSLKPQPTDSDELGGIEIAQKITGLAKPTIYGLVAQAKIPHMKRGKRLYFSRKELTDWIKEGARKTGKDIDEEARRYTSNSRAGGTK